MPTIADLLTLIEEQESLSIKKLANELEISEENLHEILTSLCQHNFIEYNQKIGTITLPKWLTNIDRKINSEKSAVAEILLSKYREMQIQDVLIGNYTGKDLELKIRLRAKSKEIAICDVI